MIFVFTIIILYGTIVNTQNRQIGGQNYHEGENMIYAVNIEKLPKVVNVYTVVRKTVWQVADPYHILLIILNGECMLELNNKTYKLARGSVFFIPADQSYRRFPSNDQMCEMMYIHFTTVSPVQELVSADAAAEVKVLQQRIEQSLLNTQRFFSVPMTKVYLPQHSHEKTAPILKICDEISELLRSFRIDNSLFVSLYLCQILSLISQDTLTHLSEKAADTELLSVPPNLKKAVWYIKQNESKKITLTELCSYCNISQAQMIRYFKTAFSKTPMQYISEFKINRAREMFLTATDLSIKNICAALGFDDQHYFSRLFTKITGETPTQYRYRVTHFKNSEE